jgi:crotonobetainyl-CoA:carnitine CoA-transferase CaiB-like acyl-CoA transferase
VGSRVPNVGEHNKDIYQGELGLSEDEIKTLAEDGVI